MIMISTAISYYMVCSHSLCFSVQYFRGNRDRNTVVMHLLRPKIEARVIRIHPVRWVNHISMRVEFYGRAAGRFTKLRVTGFASSARFLCCCCCFGVSVVIVSFTLDCYGNVWALFSYR